MDATDKCMFGFSLEKSKLVIAVTPKPSENKNIIHFFSEHENNSLGRVIAVLSSDEFNTMLDNLAEIRQSIKDLE